MSLKIFLSHDFFFLRSLRLDTNKHAHIAPQISIATPGSKVSGDGLEGPAYFLPSNFPHSVGSEAILHTYFINPAHPKARLLSETKRVGRTFEPPIGLAEALAALPFEKSDQEALGQHLESLLDLLLGKDNAPQPLDERIAEAVDYIDELDQKRVAAGQLAEQIALSESRFLHLFKDEMHMTLRKYLLWKRTTEGARLVVEGSSVTDAAHESGFTDSAHFAKAFKQTFGVTITRAFGQEPSPVLVVSP